MKKGFLSKPDKSGIGGIDDAIKPLIKVINNNSDFYTTSSCAGRIILIIDAKTKQESVFIFVTHKKASFNEIRKALKSEKAKRDMIYLKEEPCILHVACRTIEDAEKLVNIARQSGWKKSGIISTKHGKVMAEIISTEILAAPVSNMGKMLFGDPYLKILVEECNKKLTQTRVKIKNLEKSFKTI